MNLEKEIENAKIFNWCVEICKIADKLCLEKKNEVDLMIQILNGDIISQAQDIFSMNKKLGKYDNMNMPKEVNLWKLKLYTN